MLLSHETNNPNFNRFKRFKQLELRRALKLTELLNEVILQGV